MPSQVPSSPALDFKQAVALQFASRPTLRQVIGHKLLQLIRTRHPQIASVQPQLTSAEPLRLLVPQFEHAWTSRPLVDFVLQAMLEGKVLDLESAFGRDYGLTVAQPYSFREQDGGEFTYIELHGLSDAVNELVQQLPQIFQQAQVDYWRGESSLGVSRDRWFQQVLRSALLRNLSLQGLDNQQQDCIYGLLSGDSQRSKVFTVEVQLEASGQHFQQTLANLLVIGVWNARTVVLWCSPSSVVRAFESLDDFALALGEELAEQLQFDSISWNRHELEGDIFSQQTALLLDAMLESVLRMNYSQLADVGEMEQVYAALADPSQWFIEGYFAASDSNIVQPSDLRNASADDSFAYQCAVFDLALAQAESRGASALEDVQDLYSYTRQRLREQMLADHPDDANYLSDDLSLTVTVARGTPGGIGAGVGGGVVEIRSMSLTEFAIGNLSSLQGAILSDIEHRSGQLIMDWMNVDYVKSLVEKVDIGGNYPSYVAQKLDDPATREQRITCFAREWRCSLLFSALSAKLAGSLSEAALQCVADYGRGHVDSQTPAIVLMPLAFKREPTASSDDQVRGMFVLFSAEPSVVLLYRPLYASAPLTEFVSLTAMMMAIRDAGPLQDSILDWLTTQARSVYAHGGFHEPHLRQPILDTSLLPEPVQPASFAAQFWRGDVDARLYKANRDLLIELAERQSVSNAESRWAILTEGAWLLFDVATLLLRGPVATVAWVIQGIHGLSSDVSALTQGTAFERSAAVVDVLLNLGMALLHARLPRQKLPAPVPKKATQPAALYRRPGSQLDFTWRGRQGFNMLTGEQRKTLQAMRSDVSLNGLNPITSGITRGLYRVDEHYYAALVGDAYPVEVSGDGVRIADVHGRPGPWLSYEHGAWRVDSALRLNGGMPRSRVEIQREANKKQFEEDKTREVQLSIEQGVLAARHNKIQGFLDAKGTRIEELEDKAKTDELQELEEAELAGLRSLYKLTHQKLVGGLKPLIENGFEHIKVISDVERMIRLQPELANDFADQRNEASQQLFLNGTAYYNGLIRMINNEHLLAKGDAVNERPQTESEIKLYKDYLISLEQVVEWEIDLVEMSDRLDAFLEGKSNNYSVVFADKDGNSIDKNSDAGKVIDEGRLSSVDMKNNLLFDLAELSIDRLELMRTGFFEQHQGYLVSDALMSACTAHSDLTGSNLTLSQQIEVLGDVIEAYDEAAVLADYLGAVGGEGIKADKLQLYKKALINLKDVAQAEMSQAVREQELEAPHVIRPQLNVAKKSKRRLVKTTGGRSVLAEESEVNGVAVVQQRESRTGRVLKNFHKQGAEWVEDAAAPVDEMLSPTSPRDPGAYRGRARTLIREVDDVIALANRYSPNEPRGLSSVIEGHADKMKQVLAKLPRFAPDDELVEELDGNIRRLSNARRDMLTSLYLNTKHPTANSLQFLHQERRIDIELTVVRKVLSSNDYLDVYEIRRLPEPGQVKGDGLWEAHFHYASADTPRRQFSKAHLKVWWQRKLGREAQMRAAASGKDLLEIYRSELRLADVEGIIPFDKVVH